jgi:hypothetical protein
MITYFFVDAFNLYFGSCRNTPYKWLDLAKLFAIIFSINQIGKIKYFTARVRAKPDDPGQPGTSGNQKRKLRAEYEKAHKC